MIEAERFNAQNAMMLVHSFSQTNEWFGDYSDFASLFEIKARLNRIHYAKRVNDLVEIKYSMVGRLPPANSQTVRA